MSDFLHPIWPIIQVVYQLFPIVCIVLKLKHTQTTQIGTFKVQGLFVPAWFAAICKTLYILFLYLVPILQLCATGRFWEHFDTCHIHIA